MERFSGPPSPSRPSTGTMPDLDFFNEQPSEPAPPNRKRRRAIAAHKRYKSELLRTEVLPIITRILQSEKVAPSIIQRVHREVLKGA